VNWKPGVEKHIDSGLTILVGNEALAPECPVGLGEYRHRPNNQQHRPGSPGAVRGRPAWPEGYEPDCICDAGAGTRAEGSQPALESTRDFTLKAKFQSFW